MGKKKKRNTPSDFETFALADTAKRDRETNTTIPSVRAVKEAKDWVDHNHK